MYSCDCKAEFLSAITPVFNVTILLQHSQIHYDQFNAFLLGKSINKKKKYRKNLTYPECLNRNVDAIKKQIALGRCGIESNYRNLCASKSVRSICVSIHVEIRHSDLIPLTGVPSAKQM